MRAVLAHLGALLDPPTCLLCGASGPQERLLCATCLAGCPHPGPPCPSCSSGLRNHSLPPCPLCRDRPPGLPLRSPGAYEGSLRKLILAAKWRHVPAALPVLAEWILSAARPDGWLDGLEGWCPVPRDLWRTLRHGVPLAEHLGKELGARLALPRLPPPHRRWRHPQARLTGATRRRNLRGAFHVGPRHRRRLRDRRVLLVDDVLTTGTTLAECARALRQAGVAEVRAVVAACAMRD